MSRTGSIKRSQKEAQFRKVMSDLIQKASLDYPQLFGVTVSRVVLSPDKSTCNVFFYSIDGETAFAEQLEHLKLFKPSLRKALAQAVPARYVPEIIFHYDAQLEKQLKIEALLDKVKHEAD